MNQTESAGRDECNLCYLPKAQHTGKTHAFEPIAFGARDALEHAIGSYNTENMKEMDES